MAYPCSGQVYSLDFCVYKSSMRPDRKGLSRRRINGFRCGYTWLPSRSDNVTGLAARTFSYSVSHQCNTFTVTKRAQRTEVPEHGWDTGTNAFLDHELSQMSCEWEFLKHRRGREGGHSWPA